MVSCAIVLKMCSPELSPLLATINAWLNLVFLPVGRKSSTVVPVFKNDGERSDPSKYRPIYKSSSYNCKIFESFINDSLTKHLDIIGHFSDLQYGFSGPLLTFWMFSVSVFTIRWMLVERWGLLNLISERHSIRFGIQDCFIS